METMLLYVKNKIHALRFEPQDIQGNYLIKVLTLYKQHVD